MIPGKRKSHKMKTGPFEKIKFVDHGRSDGNGKHHATAKGYYRVRVDNVHCCDGEGTGEGEDQAEARSDAVRSLLKDEAEKAWLASNPNLA